MPPLSMRQLQLMQMVPTAGKLGTFGAETRSRAVQAGFAAAAARWAARRAVATAFFELQRVDRSLVIMGETRRLVADLRRLAVTMYEVGEGRQADVLRADVEVARMDEEIVRMESMRLGLAAQLLALQDAEPGSTVPSPATVTFPLAPPALDALVAARAAARPEVHGADAAVQAAEFAARRARAELWPDLLVGVQVGTNRSLEGMQGTMGSLMVGASLPVFARDRQLRMREEALAMRTMADADRRMLLAETASELAMVHATLARVARLRTLYDSQILPAAHAAVEASRASYRVGTLSFMNLLDNQMTVNRYRLDRVAIEAEAGAAWAMLETLTGQRWLDHSSVTGGGHD